MVSAETLKPLIQSTFNLETTGGNVIIRDPNTLIMTDCSDVLHGQIDYIVQKYPQITVEFISTSSSKTGFIVIFGNIENINLWQTSCFFQVVLSLLILLASSSVCYNSTAHATPTGFL